MVGDTHRRCRRCGIHLVGIARGEASHRCRCSVAADTCRCIGGAAPRWRNLPLETHSILLMSVNRPTPRDGAGIEPSVTTQLDLIADMAIAPFVRQFANV